MSNLAPPAPQVEPSVAEKAENTDAAKADMVSQTEEARVSAAQEVEPAVTYDDPRKFAPKAPVSKGSNALSVKALRGGKGSDFESYAAVLRGAPGKNFLQIILPFIFDERDFVTFGEVKKYVLIKGTSCFVYTEEHDPSPVYAIPLHELYPIQEDPKNPDKGSVTISPVANTNKPPDYLTTILLKYKKNNAQAYQFTFDTSEDRTVAKRFYDVVENCGKKGRGPVTASVVRAHSVAKKKAKAQPTI